MTPSKLAIRNNPRAVTGNARLVEHDDGHGESSILLGRTLIDPRMRHLTGKVKRRDNASRASTPGVPFKTIAVVTGRESKRVGQCQKT